VIHRRAPWKTKEAVEFATLVRVSWFNHYRLLQPIGYIPPAEAEANYYRQLASQTATMVALTGLHQSRGDSVPRLSEFYPQPSSSFLKCTGTPF